MVRAFPVLFYITFADYIPVFEYRFTAPNTKGEDKNWWVMWDYYNGLVRVHDFFDCCKPGKVSIPLHAAT
jgi:hypothetical protein